MRYIKAFQKAELEIKNQCELKLQEKIAAFKKKHRKELDMLDAHLKNVEASYKDKCTEISLKNGRNLILFAVLLALKLSVFFY